MIAEITHHGRTFKVDLARPIDLSFPLHAGEDQLRAWWVEPVRMEAVRNGDTEYAVKSGAPVNFRNVFFNQGQQVLAVSDAAWKQQQRLAKKFDNVRTTLDKQIAHFEQELSQPLESRAAVTIAGEVRRFVKDMPVEERHKFVRQAIDDGHHITVSAVLGAPPYLSGFDANLQETYTRMWWERTTPQLATKLKAVRNAKAVIEERGGLLFKEIEKSMGSTWAKVNELRHGNDKALTALKFGE